MPTLIRQRRAGLTLMEMFLVIAIIGVLFGILLVAIQQARNTSLRLACANNMRQLGLALHNYHDAQRFFPPGVRHPVLASSPPSDLLSDPYPLMSWYTHLLPFLDQEPLWQATQKAYAEDPYLIDDPPHIGLTTFLTIFSCPADSRRATPRGSTSYLGVEGVNQFLNDGMLFLDSRIRFADVTDGTSNTLFVGERPASHDGRFGWWYGGYGAWGSVNSYLGVEELGDPDLIDTCSNIPYLFSPGRLQDPCSVFHFWSLHPGGDHFLAVDGSVHFLPYSAASILPALATRSGSDVAHWPD